MPATRRAPLLDGVDDLNLDTLLDQVRRMARHLHQRLPAGAGVQVEELFSAGQLALVEAARRFDRTRGADFWTFVHYRIHGAMIDELRELAAIGPRRRRRTEGESSDGEQDAGIPAHPAPRCVPLAAAYRIADEDHPDAEDELARLRDTDLVRRARERLPERLRIIVEMRVERGLRLKEIADYLGVTQGRACQLLSRAIELLRAAMGVQPIAA